LTTPDLPAADTRSAHPVLVVEDDREQRETLCAMLDLEGFRHAEAGNGQEALDYLAGFPAPCLVLLDVDMPVMNGWDFRAIQLADARLAGIPVVVVTSNDKGLEVRFPGVAGFLWKPLVFENLAVLLHRLCLHEAVGLLPATAGVA